MFHSTKSPLRYPGGKSRARKIIYDYLPNLDTLVSPFAGGCSVEIGLAGMGTTVFAYDILSPLVSYWRYQLTARTVLRKAVAKLHPLAPDQFKAIKASLPAMKHDFP